MAIALRTAQTQIDSLTGLLEAERARSADLLEKLLFAMAASPAPIGSFAPMEPSAPLTSQDVEWRWPDLQPEDEAREDVLAQVRSGQMAREEAEAILEALGFEHTDVDIDQ